jgi:broad specificity phosphatase PhoE
VLEIYLVATQDSAEEPLRGLGAHDPGLSRDAQAAAEQLGRWLASRVEGAGAGASGIVCAPWFDACQTGQILGDWCGMDVRIEPAWVWPWPTAKPFRAELDHLATPGLTPAEAVLRFDRVADPQDVAGHWWPTAPRSEAEVLALLGASAQRWLLLAWARKQTRQVWVARAATLETLAERCRAGAHASAIQPGSISQLIIPSRHAFPSWGFVNQPYATGGPPGWAEMEK